MSPAERDLWIAALRRIQRGEKPDPLSPAVEAEIAADHARMDTVPEQTEPEWA